MYNIRYYYASISKQIFIGILMLNALSRLILFFVSGIYKDAYVIPTVILYFLFFCLCIFFLVGYRFYLGTFDENQIEFKGLFGKSSIDYDSINKVFFTDKKVEIQGNDKKNRLIIPHYRFGPVSPVGIENFYAMMRNKGVPTQMEPGGIPAITTSFLFRIGYTVLSILIFFNSFNYILLIYLVLTASAAG